MYPVRLFKHYKQSNKLVNGIYLFKNAAPKNDDDINYSNSKSTDININHINHKFEFTIAPKVCSLHFRKVYMRTNSFLDSLHWLFILSLFVIAFDAFEHTHISTPSFLYFHFHPSIHTISCSHRETQQCQSQ